MVWVCILHYVSLRINSVNPFDFDCPHPQAARSVDSLRSALGVITEDDDRDALATIYIHDTRDGYCGLCGACVVAGC